MKDSQKNIYLLKQAVEDIPSYIVRPAYIYAIRNSLYDYKIIRIFNPDNIKIYATDGSYAREGSTISEEKGYLFKKLSDDFDISILDIYEGFLD